MACASPSLRGELNTVKLRTFGSTPKGVPLYQESSHFGPEPGQNAVYEGTFKRRTIEAEQGSPQGQSSPNFLRASPMTFRSSFNTKVPRPWQQKPEADRSPTRLLGPGQYETFVTSHGSSKGMSTWGNRGRTGDVGVVFRGNKPTPCFASERSRFGADGVPRRISCQVMGADERRERPMISSWQNDLVLRMQMQQAVRPF